MLRLPTSLCTRIVAEVSGLPHARSRITSAALTLAADVADLFCITAASVAIASFVRPRARRATELGDRGWRALLDYHDQAVRREFARFRGREVKTLDDGFLATFDGPARAVRCTSGIIERAHPLGIEVRSGLHTGEIEIQPNDVGGIAVHIAARVAAMADPREVLVSSTVRDLVRGAAFRLLMMKERLLRHR